MPISEASVPFPMASAKAAPTWANNCSPWVIPAEEIVYNEGYMSAKTGYNGDTLSFQIGVSANPGNSGGPVFNKNGEVIGIINARQQTAEGVVFAITARNIFRNLEEIKKDSTFQNISLNAQLFCKELWTGFSRSRKLKRRCLW